SIPPTRASSHRRPASAPTSARRAPSPSGLCPRTIRSPVPVRPVRTAKQLLLHAAVPRSPRPHYDGERCCAYRCNAPTVVHSVATSLRTFVGSLPWCRAPPCGPTADWWHHRSRRSTNKPGHAPPTSKTANCPASPSLQNRLAVRATYVPSLLAVGEDATTVPGSSTCAGSRGSRTTPLWLSIPRPGWPEIRVPLPY